MAWERKRGKLEQFNRLLVDGDDGAHIASSYDDIQVVVAGGAGRHSCIIPSFGNTRAVTEVIVA